MGGRIQGSTLTPAEELFLEAYLSNGYNRADAVRKAGYTVNNESTYGGKVLARPAVQKELQKRMDKARHSFFVQELDVLEGLYREANSHGKGYTQAGRINAWVAIGKHLGMFNEGKAGAHGATAGTQINIVNYNNDASGKNNTTVVPEVVENLKTVTNTESHLKELGLDSDE